MKIKDIRTHRSEFILVRAADREEEQARRYTAATWKRATSGRSGGSGGMTGESEHQAGHPYTTMVEDLGGGGDMMGD